MLMYFQQLPLGDTYEETIKDETVGNRGGLSVSSVVIVDNRTGTAKQKI